MVQIRGANAAATTAQLASTWRQLRAVWCVLASIALFGCKSRGVEGGVPEGRSESNGTAAQTTTAFVAPADGGELRVTEPQESTPGAQADFDRRFIDLMASHRRDSITLLELAVGRAEHPELRSFASETVSECKGELENLKDWRARWYGHGEIPPNAGTVMLPDMPEHVVVATAPEIERLKLAKPFDKALIELLLPHKQMAIDAAKVASLRAAHAEIKAYARSSVDRHEKEVEKLKAWYTRWYGSGRK